MKKLFLTVCFLAIASVSWAASVSLAWDPLSNPNLGVRIYIGTESGIYTYSHEAGIGTTETTIDDLASGETYYFVARSFTTGGSESRDSNEVSCYITPAGVVLPVAPTGLRITEIILE